MKYKHTSGIIAIDHPDYPNEVIINGARFPKDFVTKSKEWKEDPEFLFVSEDGVKIKPGDSWWYITLPDLDGPRETRTMTYNGKNKRPVLRFSTSAAARNHIIRNKPVLSINDIQSIKEGNLYDIVERKIFG